MELVQNSVERLPAVQDRDNFARAGICGLHSVLGMVDSMTKIELIIESCFDCPRLRKTQYTTRAMLTNDIEIRNRIYCGQTGLRIYKADPPPEWCPKIKDEA